MFTKLFIMVLGVLGVATSTISGTTDLIAKKNLGPSLPKSVATEIPAPSQSKLNSEVKKTEKIATKPSVGATSQKTVEPKVNESKPVAISTPTSPKVDFEQISKKSREAVVNILCTSKSGGSFEPVSGSGVIIDPKGIILTNAHIAQFLLLKDYRTEDFVKCVARTGSPATSRYNLQIVYISPEWLNSNYKQFTSQHQTGTGENDYALLKIIGSTDPDITVAPPYPFINIETEDNYKLTNSTVALVAYPAGFLGGISIQKDLYMASTLVNIKKIFTFREGYVDVLSLGGSIVAQQGSSGGAVINSKGNLIGIISTYVSASDTSNRELDAITLAHINRQFSKNNGQSIKSLLNSGVETFASSFNTTHAPVLKNLLIGELNKSFSQ